MANQKYKKFVKLAKVDEAKREVWGIVTAEVPDKDGQVCDYASSKPYYEAWSAEAQKMTDGKSCGNLREMHTKSAVGKGLAIEFRDDEKQVYMGFKVVDDVAWTKVQEGVYAGFSQGGDYIKIWQQGDHEWYTASPAEVSLVDNPCLGVATYEYIKADGAKELRKFKNTEEHMADKKFDVSKAAAAVKGMEKGMYTVSSLAQLLQSLAYIQEDTQWEADYEGDNSPLPDQLADNLKELSATLVAMVDEETKELVGNPNTPDLGEMEMSVKVDLIKKAKTAIEHVEKAVELHKEMKDKHAELGKCHEAISKCHGKMEECLGKCQKAVQSLSDDNEENAEVASKKDDDDVAAEKAVNVADLVKSLVAAELAKSAPVKVEAPVAKAADESITLSESELVEAVSLVVKSMVADKAETESKLGKRTINSKGPVLRTTPVTKAQDSPSATPAPTAVAPVAATKEEIIKALNGDADAMRKCFGETKSSPMPSNIIGRF